MEPTLFFRYIFVYNNNNNNNNFFFFFFFFFFFTKTAIYGQIEKSQKLPHLGLKTVTKVILPQKFLKVIKISQNVLKNFKKIRKNGKKIFILSSEISSHSRRLAGVSKVPAK